MKTAPCKDCEKRYLGCHSHCEDYKAFQDYRAQYNADRQARREYEDMFHKKRLHGRMR